MTIFYRFGANTNTWNLNCVFRSCMHYYYWGCSWQTRFSRFGRLCTISLLFAQIIVKIRAFQSNKNVTNFIYEYSNEKYFSRNKLTLLQQSNSHSVWHSRRAHRIASNETSAVKHSAQTESHADDEWKIVEKDMKKIKNKMFENKILYRLQNYSIMMI